MASSAPDLESAVQRALLENGRRPAELVMNPADVRELARRHGQAGRLRSYCDVPVVESPYVPEGTVYVMNGEFEEVSVIGLGRSELIRTGPASVTVDGKKVGEMTGMAVTYDEMTDKVADAADRMQELNDILAVSGRMLPPPEFQLDAIRAARAAGMGLEWCQEPSGQAGRTDTWAHVRTGRGSFDVRPERGQSWTDALAAVGVVIPLP